MTDKFKEVPKHFLDRAQEHADSLFPDGRPESMKDPMRVHWMQSVLDCGSGIKLEQKRLLPLLESARGIAGSCNPETCKFLPDCVACRLDIEIKQIKENLE